MKSFLKISVLLIALAFIFNSCSKSNDQTKMIPKNALVVVHLNTKSLTSKLSWEEVKQTTWFKEMYNDTTVKSWTKKLMDNPGGTGIDLSAGMFIFVQKSFGNEGQVVLEGELKDALAFEAFNKNLDEKATATKDGEINMLTLKGESVVGWNDKKFAYVINSVSLTPKIPYGADSSNMFNTPVANISLSQVCKNVFILNADSSMAKNEKFTNLLKEDGDVHVWQNTEEIVKSSAQLGMMSMLKLDVFLKGNISTFTANFDNGKIDVKQKFYASEELTDMLKKYGGGKINTEMIKNIPSQNVTGILALHFQPEGIREIIKLTGMDGFLNVFLTPKGITLDDFIKANKGDLLFAVTDFVIKKDSVSTGDESDKTSPYIYDKPGASYLFSVSIGDRPSFDKLMSAGKKMGEDIGESMGVFNAGNDKYFALGNSQQYVSKYISGSNNSFDFINKIEDHPIALFIDIQKILATSAPMAAADSSANVIMNESIKTWQNIYSMGGEFKDNAFVMSTEINLVDKTTNSLKQLNTYFDKISKVMMEKHKENMATAYPVDSSEMMMPMDTMSVSH